MSYHYVSLLKLNVSYYEISLLNTLTSLSQHLLRYSREAGGGAAPPVQHGPAGAQHPQGGGGHDGQSKEQSVRRSGGPAGTDRHILPTAAKLKNLYLIQIGDLIFF